MPKNKNTIQNIISDSIRMFIRLLRFSCYVLGGHGWKLKRVVFDCKCSDFVYTCRLCGATRTEPCSRYWACADKRHSMDDVDPPTVPPYPEIKSVTREQLDKATDQVIEELRLMGLMPPVWFISFGEMVNRKAFGPRDKSDGQND